MRDDRKLSEAQLACVSTCEPMLRLMVGGARSAARPLIRLGDDECASAWLGIAGWSWGVESRSGWADVRGSFPTLAAAPVLAAKPRGRAGAEGRGRRR